MDVDAYVAVHNAEWIRLEQLINRPGKLTGAEVDELVELYQRAATHLSVVRSASPDPAVVGRLSSLVSRARAAVGGANAPLWRDLFRTITVSFPGTVYRMRWWWIGCAVLGNVFALVVAVWIANDPEVQAAIGSPFEIQQYLEKDFVNYYTDHDAGAFAFQVWVNNAWVSALAITFGILLGIPVILVLLTNQLNLAVAAGLFAAHGKLGLFFGLILPHGMLELTAVYVACGVGLKLGWTVIDPGRRPRGQALAEEGRAAMSVALGLIGVLLVSGAIEGFVTGWVHTTWLRIGIGVVAEIGFLAYVWYFGRKAVAAGDRGDAPGVPDLAPVSG